MTRQELEAWLCGGVAPRPTPAWFTLAVLRDAFADERAVVAWLRAARIELGGASAADALRAGRTDAVEALAVVAWHAAGGRVVPNDRPRARVVVRRPRPWTSRRRRLSSG